MKKKALCLKAPMLYDGATFTLIGLDKKDEQLF